MSHGDGDITQLLARVRDGSVEASRELFESVYRELRQLAAHYMRSERKDHTLQPTALVHEAFVRLVNQRELSLESRSHFFGVAANVMRRVLIDHARAHRSQKRGRGEVKVALDDAPEPFIDLEYLLEVNDALERLSALDRRQAQVVELRFFGGLSVEQIAEVLGVGPRTVDRDWRIARAWLRRELGSSDAPADQSNR
jgi:RNA polymerase sigma-70 factor, ECF subfamily